MAHSVRDQTAKSAGDGACRNEEADTLRQLALQVPQGQVERDSLREIERQLSGSSGTHTSLLIRVGVTLLHVKGEEGAA